MSARKHLRKGMGIDNLQVLKQRWRMTTPKTGLFLCLKNINLRSVSGSCEAPEAIVGFRNTGRIFLFGGHPMSNPAKPFQLSISFPIPLDTPESTTGASRAIFSVPGKTLLINKEGAALLSDFFTDLTLVLGKGSTDEHLEQTFKELSKSCCILPIPEDSDDTEASGEEIR